MKSYCIHKVLLDAASLKVEKGHTKVNIKLGWKSDENIITCKATTRCRQILRHYHIYKELQHATIRTWPSSKGQTKVNIELVRFWCGEYLCKVTTWCMQFLRSYCVHKVTWLWASLKVKKVTQRSISKSSDMLMWRTSP